MGKRKQNSKKSSNRSKKKKTEEKEAFTSSDQQPDGEDLNSQPESQVSETSSQNTDNGQLDNTGQVGDTEIISEEIKHREENDEDDVIKSNCVVVLPKVVNAPEDDTTATNEPSNEDQVKDEVLAETTTGQEKECDKILIVDPAKTKELVSDFKDGKSETALTQKSNVTKDDSVDEGQEGNKSSTTSAQDNQDKVNNEEAMEDLEKNDASDVNNKDGTLNASTNLSEYVFVEMKPDLLAESIENEVKMNSTAFEIDLTDLDVSDSQMCSVIQEQCLPPKTLECTKTDLGLSSGNQLVRSMIRDMEQMNRLILGAKREIAAVKLRMKDALRQKN